MIRSRRSRRREWLLFALGVAITAAACGNQVQPAPDTTPPTAPSESTSATLAESPTTTTAPGTLSTGLSTDGSPLRGDPTAPVTIIEYSDYACPFCGRYNTQTLPALLNEYGVAGDVNFAFRDFPLAALHPTAPTAHAAALCVGEQDGRLYWAFHDALFARQPEWTKLTDPADFLSDLATNVGADSDAYRACVASGRTATTVDENVAEARSFGFDSTPSFQFVADGLPDTYTLVGAQPIETFRAYLDALLDGRAPDETATAGTTEPNEPADLPVWADPETGLRPDPDRPGVDLAGDHYKGNPEASLVVIEFSDFQCPFCREHALERQPEIDAALVDTGDVLWVFKHLPLDSHTSARTAAVAAECAGDQERFWEMHDLLFETVDRWTDESVDTDTVLLALADELQLDHDTFEQCLLGRDALERVLADVSDAEGVVSRTPSFIVIRGTRGSLIQGSLPSEQFIATLRDRLQG